VFKKIILAAVLLLPLSAAAPPANPDVSFGARESVQQISLSPSGNKLAYIAPGPGPATIVYTVDVKNGGMPVKAATASGDPERLTSCTWVSEERLVCTLYGVVKEGEGAILPFSRIVAVDADGANVKLLSLRERSDAAYVNYGGGDVIDWLPAEDGAVLMGRYYVPEERSGQGTRLEDKREGYAVDRVDTRTLASKSLESPKKQAAEYISDGRGNIRIMGINDVAGATGYDSGKTRYFYRTKTDREWKLIGVYDGNAETGFNPYAVDADLDIAYGFKKRDGRWALHSYALDGSGREALIYAHPQVDVDGLIRIGRTRRVVGASFATDKRGAVYFDKKLEALAASLSKALPGLPLVQFTDSSLDGNKLLIWAGSDTDPGRYYIFDKAAQKLDEIMLSRPQLEGATLAQVKPITFKAADGTGIPAYLTLPAGSDGKNLPAIVMPHGGPGSRDEWGFDWLSQYYASRGYAVLQPNFRGSAGYGDAWFQNNGFQSWRTAIGDVNDGGRWLVSQGIGDPAKLAIVGWSYGGYAALQSAVLDPDLFKAIVAVAPVTDLAMLSSRSRRFSNYRIVRDFIGSGPHVREGSPAQNASRIKAPVLMFHGTLDTNVDIAHSRLMAEKLGGAGKTKELVVYPKLDHYLDDAAARTDMLRKSDAFLRASMGM